MAEKSNTIKDLDQTMIDLNLEMIEEYRKGYVNENKIRAADVIIRLYDVIKNANKTK